MVYIYIYIDRYLDEIIACYFNSVYTKKQTKQTQLVQKHNDRCFIKLLNNACTIINIINSCLKERISLVEFNLIKIMLLFQSRMSSPTCLDYEKCHISPKEWKCPIEACEKILSRRQTLQDHLGNIHGIHGR